MSATVSHRLVNSNQNSKRSLSNLIKKNADRFGSRYGFTKSEIEEIYQECYKELKAGLA